MNDPFLASAGMLWGQIKDDIFIWSASLTADIFASHKV